MPPIRLVAVLRVSLQAWRDDRRTTSCSSDAVTGSAGAPIDRPMPSGDRTTPTRIHADRGAGTLAIDWADGHSTLYNGHDLRWLCPCAFCRGEAGLPGWLDTSPTLTPEQTRLEDVHLVGSYAIAPTWGDGHHTGYYPFALLRERCSCPEDTQRRARS
jgi:DUF971 family protein